MAEHVGVSFKINKMQTEKQLVSGWANVSLMPDGTPPLDWQGDIIAPEELENAAIQFMMDYRASGVMHEGGCVGTVVESIVFTEEKQRILGIPSGVLPQGWFITVKVHDAQIFEMVKAGKYRMFSIQGTANRTPI